MNRPAFETQYTPTECRMLEDAYDAVTECNLWEWLKTYSPHANEGFLLSTHPNLNAISLAMQYDTHSGASFAWTLRTLQSIARLGWEAHGPAHRSK